MCAAVGKDNRCISVSQHTAKMLLSAEKLVLPVAVIVFRFSDIIGA